jgi:Zn-dependent alcohol dehydrogenase
MNTALKSSKQQQAANLAKELAQLVIDIAGTQTSIAELVKMRQEEQQEFETGLADVTKTINAIARQLTSSRVITPRLWLTFKKSAHACRWH